MCRGRRWIQSDGDMHEIKIYDAKNIYNKFKKENVEQLPLFCMITKVIKGHKNTNLGSHHRLTDSKTVRLTMAFNMLRIMKVSEFSERFY